MLGYTPGTRGSHPHPGADTPPRSRHPRSRPPQWDQRQAPPTRADTPPREQTLPASACWEIHATSGRYASYWNAILLRTKFRGKKNFAYSFLCLDCQVKQIREPWRTQAVKLKICRFLGTQFQLRIHRFLGKVDRSLFALYAGMRNCLSKSICIYVYMYATYRRLCMRYIQNNAQLYVCHSTTGHLRLLKRGLFRPINGPWTMDQ